MDLLLEKVKSFVYCPSYTITWGNSYDSYTYTYNGLVERPAPGNHFVVVNVTIQNMTDVTQSLTPDPTFSLYSQGDQQSWGVARFMMTANVSIQAQNSQTVQIVFVVPNDACGAGFSVSGLGASGSWSNMLC